MGEMILFRLRASTNRKERDSAERAGARIVFFTGVRYSRMPETVYAAGSGDSGAPPAGDLGGARRGRRRRGT
jgi:hypothetical protein